MWVTMPVSPMFRNSWPSLSCLLEPSLALSWSDHCRVLWRAWTMTCCFALYVPSAFISTGLCPWLRVATTFSSLRASPLAPCLRMRFRSSCARSFMGLRRPFLRWVQSVPMTFVVSLPRWRSTATGRSPRFLTHPPEAPFRCLPPFTCATFSMNFKVFARWVRSWLRVRGLSSPHLFLICSVGGWGGGSMSPLSPRLRYLLQVLVVVACPSSSGLGVSHFVFLLSFFSMFLFFICFYACPSLKCPVGLCYMDTWRDEWLGFLRDSYSHFPGLCRLVLTCSHDSLFLRYPAIDIVWLGPVFLALGSLRHLAFRGSAWCSLSPGWCSLLSLSWSSRLTFLTLTHGLAFTILHLWYQLWHQPPMVSLSMCVYLCSLFYFCLFIAHAHPAVRVNDWNRAI